MRFFWILLLVTALTWHTALTDENSEKAPVHQEAEKTKDDGKSKPLEDSKGEISTLAGFLNVFLRLLGLQPPKASKQLVQFANVPTFQELAELAGFLFGITKWDRFWLGYPEKLGLPEKELTNSERRVDSVDDIEGFVDTMGNIEDNPEFNFDPKENEIKKRRGLFS
ncbi:unnamed protein product [Cyprideis torosa]|uniref:Uncharacterized protein n=1 Tax=Cyprideis torosa TaxID=163714 RepID=A0A7R8W090_9CRUS|nr:unnamed protein product [Cyprideis torosa]CAG0879512.1 unnamed protein product [Cyprideis torosa]